MAGGGGNKGFMEGVASMVVDKVRNANELKDEQARQMYQDAIKNNALYQSMQERWNNRQTAGGQASGAVNPATGVVNNIANTALRNVSGQNTTDYGVMGTQGTGGNASVRSQYQGS